jgi:hypothetical protein
MANKKIWLGMLGLLLVFGNDLVSCEENKNSATSNVFFFSDPHSIIGQERDQLCVIADNKVKFYTLDWSNNTYRERAQYQFNLPTGYKGAFIGKNNDLCVIVDGKVKSYHYWGSWDEATTDFTLPSGYKGVVSGWGVHLCVIIGNKVTFYDYDYDYSDTWKESVDYGKFDLPSGYKGVCGFILNNRQYLCVTVGGKIKLYNYNNGWKEEYEFPLPSGFTGNVIGFYHNLGFAIVTDGKFKIYGADRIGEELQETGREITIPK